MLTTLEEIKIQIEKSKHAELKVTQLFVKQWIDGKIQLVAVSIKL